MELGQQEDSVAFKKSAYLGDEHVILGPESIPLFADGISLILSRWVKLQETVAKKRNYWKGLAEYISLTSGKVKHEAVEKMAADILAFFLQPEVHCSPCRSKTIKEPCKVGHVHHMLQELMKTAFNHYGIGPALLEVGEKLFNLHQDLLQGKYDSVEKLRKTLTWIGEHQMELLRKQGEEELEAARSRHRKISRRQRQKFRAYFV